MSTLVDFIVISQGIKGGNSYSSYPETRSIRYNSAFPTIKSLPIYLLGHSHAWHGGSSITRGSPAIFPNLFLASSSSAWDGHGGGEEPVDYIYCSYDSLWKCIHFFRW